MKVANAILIIGAATLLSGCAAAAGATKVMAAAGEATGIMSEDSVAALSGTADAMSAAAEEFTPEQEYYIGRAVAGTILGNYKPYNNSGAQIYLNKICQALALNSKIPELYKGYYVAILDTDEINALSSSGGHIMITRGLINCALSEDALAAVIAHEIAHIHLQHGIRAIKASRKTEALKSLAGTALIVATDGSSSGKELVKLFDQSIGDVVSTMVNSGYSQKQEFAADEMALKLMADAGYKPEAMKEMLTVLKSKSGANDRGFGKTHPTADKRLGNLSSEYKKYSVEDTTAARAARYNSSKIK